jgi:hypothetical protein
MRRGILGASKASRHGHPRSTRLKKILLKENKKPRANAFLRVRIRTSHMAATYSITEAFG